ncbi:MORC family CW-type zinc finger protein 3-like isoform X2 [Triplophysa dalaica]|uniref:MORC family CW-type zinc finger protein 3-like isoform X2 n=1 Tax=Triplophysa dalaica TaxID=1582913 RepID=UPI0024DF5AB3|nr:MORC family CW-type zinc finger protein 3-like isoform X2 [Triplophysa dalaica]
MAAQTEEAIPLSLLNPKFLHTNSTSHTWPFSAIAELIDNAYDPDVGAKQFWIDKRRIGGKDCLIFTDNGAGMDHLKMHKMLSFGFSDKKAKNGHVPIGFYGNGFKSGSMRLGKDAIVFSKNGESMCVGMLSQTYLQEIQAGSIVVPIVKFKRNGDSICPDPKHAASLQAILQNSLFQMKEELHAELDAINNHGSKGSRGTRIIIWNLRITSSDSTEFDFESDSYDIKIPDDVYESENEKYKQSLRAYCSVLYLKPRMQIIIRGQKVKTQLIAKSLGRVVTEKYKPTFLNKKSLPIIFGYNPKSKKHYGVMMYHKNRLIKAYERVGCQNRANKKGVGVIAVIECNFLKPTHNKQDFDNTDEYRRTMRMLGTKLDDYCKAMRNKIDQSTVPMEEIPECPDQNWVQCDDCMKWRKLPDGINPDKLPENWFCRMNPNTEYRECETPEEAEDNGDETLTYLKYKEQTRNQKKLQEQKKFQMEEQQRLAELPKEENEFQRRQENLLDGAGLSPSRSSTAAETARNLDDSRPLPLSASRPSDNVSASSITGRKRSLEQTESQVLKKARALSEYLKISPDGPSTFKSLSDVPTSQMEISENNDTVDKKDVKCNTDDDEDLVIDETKSTPKHLTLNLAKVKIERSTSNDVQDRYPVSMETPATEASTSEMTGTSISNGQVRMTTQTECGMAVKMVEDQKRKEEVEIKKEESENDATMMEQSSSEVECKKDKDTRMNRSIKDSMETERCNSADIESKPSLSEGSDREKDAPSAMPEQTSISSFLNIHHVPTLEAEKQQNSPLELMDATSLERDEFKTEAQSLTLELEKKELTVNLVLKEHTFKKEFCHQSIQTDLEDDKDFKTLYLQATQHIEQLTQTINELKKNKQEENPQILVKGAWGAVLLIFWSHLFLRWTLNKSTMTVRL